MNWGWLWRNANVVFAALTGIVSLSLLLHPTVAFGRFVVLYLVISGMIVLLYNHVVWKPGYPSMTIWLPSYAATLPYTIAITRNFGHTNPLTYIGAGLMVVSLLLSGVSARAALRNTTEDQHGTAKV